MELWERDSYKTPVKALFNHRIVEYDMKSANTSIAREFGLLPEKRIKELENLPKKDREIAVGLILRDDPGYTEKQKLGFIAARKLFFTQNEILDEEVVAIKRDAIFVMRYVNNEQVTDNIDFRMKNVYSSFINLGKNIEIYYNQEGLDIKGIDDEIYKERHSEYFGMFLYSLIRRIESSERNSYLTYLRMMFDMYKHRQLDSGYYREFNAKSQFHYLDGSYANEEYIEDLNAVDISCNLNIILKLMTMLV